MLLKCPKCGATKTIDSNNGKNEYIITNYGKINPVDKTCIEDTCLLCHKVLEVDVKEEMKTRFEDQCLRDLKPYEHH